MKMLCFSFHRMYLSYSDKEPDGGFPRAAIIHAAEILAISYESILSWQVIIHQGSLVAVFFVET